MSLHSLVIVLDMSKADFIGCSFFWFSYPSEVDCRPSAATNLFISRRDITSNKTSDISLRLVSGLAEDIKKLFQTGTSVCHKRSWTHLPTSWIFCLEICDVTIHVHDKTNK